MRRISTKIRAVTCLFILAIILVGLSGTPCMADFIWMDPGDVLSGTLTVDAGEIITGGDWVSGTTFYYEVTRPLDPTAPLHYLYTFTEVPVSPSWSHFILEVSQALEGELPAFDVGNPMDFSNGPGVEGNATPYGPSQGNPGFPVGYSIFGIKINPGESDTVEFDSYRLPMWGDFYVKGGPESFAYNSGLVNPDGAFILVPDTKYVPLPGAILLGILGLGVVGIRLRKYA